MKCFRVTKKKNPKYHPQKLPKSSGEQCDMITNEQSIGCMKWPLMYFPREVEEINRSSGSLPWLHINITWEVLTNTDAWVSLPEILI